MDGTLVHGRNLDYGGYAPLLRKMTFNLEVYRGEKFLFHATMFAGQVGFLTATKPGKFSITLDQRDYGSYIDNFSLMMLGNEGNLLAIRKVLETQESWIDAVDYLRSTWLIADCYYIVSGIGPYEGAVITRSRFSTEDVWKLDAETWYLLETNYDHWLPPPPNDDRRIPAEKFLNETGQANINAYTISELLNLDPVLNVKTVYSTVMSPSSGFYKSILPGSVPAATEYLDVNN
jgi:N-acylethanolamine-hydrolysing acid amidase